MRRELLNGEISYTLPEAVVLVEQWRRVYNIVRPRSACTMPGPTGSLADVDLGLILERAH